MVWLLSILLIGASLSMDAFAVSVSSGMTLKPFYLRYALRLGLCFGVFQAIMPFFGCLLGTTVSGYFTAWGPYISFFLLAFIGGKMLLDGIQGEEAAAMAVLSSRRLLALAIATSIDALAVGVSFAFQENVRLLSSCLLIGCTTFVISFGGALLGSAVPGVSGKRAGILGGAVLLAIGLKLLLGL